MRVRTVESFLVAIAGVAFTLWLVRSTLMVGEHLPVVGGLSGFVLNETGLVR